MVVDRGVVGVGRAAGVGLVCHYHAAPPRVGGGDFYDVFSLGRPVGVFLGDMEGHAAAAVAVTSLSRYTLRDAALHDADPAAVSLS